MGDEIKSLQVRLDTVWERRVSVEGSDLRVPRYLPEAWLEGQRLAPGRLAILESSGWEVQQFDGQSYLMPDAELTRYSLTDQYAAYQSLLSGGGSVAAYSVEEPSGYEDLLDAITQAGGMDESGILASGGHLLFPSKLKEENYWNEDRIDGAVDAVLRSGWVMVSLITDPGSYYLLSPDQIKIRRRIKLGDANVGKATLKKLTEQGLILTWEELGQVLDGEDLVVRRVRSQSLWSLEGLKFLLSSSGALSGLVDVLGGPEGKDFVLMGLVKNGSISGLRIVGAEEAKRFGRNYFKLHFEGGEFVNAKGVQGKNIRRAVRGDDDPEDNGSGGVLGQGSTGGGVAPAGGGHSFSRAFVHASYSYTAHLMWQMTADFGQEQSISYQVLLQSLLAANPEVETWDVRQIRAELPDMLSRAAGQLGIPLKAETVSTHLGISAQRLHDSMTGDSYADTMFVGAQEAAGQTRQGSSGSQGVRAAQTATVAP